MSIAPLHQGDRPRPRRRPLARRRAGPRPDEPGARPPGHRSRDRRLRPGDAHQGRIGGRARRVPRRRARALHRHPQRRRDDRAALVQRLAQDSESHRPAGDAAGAAGLARARARPGARRRARHDGRDLSRPRPGLRRQRRRRRGRVGPPRAGLHPHRDALSAAGAASRSAQRRRPAQLRAHDRQASHAAVAAARRCASSTTRIRNTVRGWPSSSRTAAPMPC